MEYPIEYRWLRANKIDGLIPWHFLELHDVEALRKEYNRETNGDILPFARRQDNDDIAGFVIKDGIVKTEVISVHLTWVGKLEKSGYPIEKSYETLFDWMYEVAFHDTVDFISEEEIQALNENK